MATLPLCCQAVLVRLEVLPHQKYVKEYVHRHDSNRDEECSEEALDPYPDDSESPLLLAVLYLLNCFEDIS